jgi:hypothetical protein
VRGFGQKLVAVAPYRFEVDLAGFQWPEPAVPGHVAQILVVVGGPDEDAAAGLIDWEASIGGPSVVVLSADEAFGCFNRYPAQACELAELDNPFSFDGFLLGAGLEMQERHVGEVVVASDDAQRGRFPAVGPSKMGT